MEDWIGDWNFSFSELIHGATEDTLTEELNSHSNSCRFPSRKMLFGF